MNLDEFDAKVDQNVMEHGIHITGVFDPDGAKPSFLYTAGLAEVGTNELIVYGLHHEVGQYLLNEIYSRYVKGDLDLSHDTQVDGMLGMHMEFPVILLQADPLKIVRDIGVSRQRLLRSQDLDPAEMQDWPIPAFLQVVLTDLDGNWPWEEEYLMDPRVQPCLILDQEEWADGDPRGT